MPADNAPPWYPIGTRIPRRDQTVRILVDTGVDHEASFVVQHTDDWPSGAWWMLSNGRSSLPFGRVVQWSPDPSARPPLEEANLEVGAGPVEQAKAPSGPPAILAETLVEIQRTGDVLLLFPASHYDWSPHPEIVSIRTLALRLVRIVARIAWILELDTLELMFEPDLPEFAEPGDIAETYAANAETVRELVPSMTGADLTKRWTLERNGAVVAEMARGEALRQFGLTPIVYHRGEAAVLITALGLKAPHPYPLWAFKDEAPADWTPPAGG